MAEILVISVCVSAGRSSFNSNIAIFSLVGRGRRGEPQAPFSTSTFKRMLRTTLRQNVGESL
jgi:hypothetical protein